MNIESGEIKRLQIIVTGKKWRIFRNARGKGFVGKLLSIKNGIAIIQNARSVEFGLSKGASDCIGWRPIEITSEMVGKTIAQFVAIEVKTKSYKNLTSKQANFLSRVYQSGGFAAVFREGSDAIEEFKQ